MIARFISSHLVARYSSSIRWRFTLSARRAISCLMSVSLPLERRVAQGLVGCRSGSLDCLIVAVILEVEENVLSWSLKRHTDLRERSQSKPVLRLWECPPCIDGTSHGRCDPGFCWSDRSHQRQQCGSMRKSYVRHSEGMGHWCQWLLHSSGVWQSSAFLWCMEQQASQDQECLPSRCRR
jgi:hypothetical protein